MFVSLSDLYVWFHDGAVECDEHEGDGVGADGGVAAEGHVVTCSVVGA
jgi:hypothetical protein